MKTIMPGTRVTVNGNDQAYILSYDKELGMYNVRLYRGSRHVGDIIVPTSSIKAA